jgi:hypothetical protein
MIDMNEFAKLAMSFEGKTLPIKHIPGPQGVRGRNSDNTLIKEKLGWSPSISIKVGLKTTFAWIKGEIYESSQSIISIYNMKYKSYLSSISLPCYSYTCHDKLQCIKDLSRETLSINQSNFPASKKNGNMNRGKVI